jgi:hypothetical protein
MTLAKNDLPRRISLAHVRQHNDLSPKIAISGHCLRQFLAAHAGDGSDITFATVGLSGELRSRRHYFA